MNRRTLLTLAAGAALLPAAGNAQSVPTAQEVLFDPDIPVLGNPDGNITIAEYFDYQCPFCKKGHPELMEIIKTDGNIRLVMKDWPIFGEPSSYASRLVLAAHSTGKYEVALHALMATERRLPKDMVDTHLKAAGLDSVSLLAAYEADKARIDAVLARNDRQASAFGLGGTPAYIIGTRIFGGFMDKQALIDAIAAARQE